MAIQNGIVTGSVNVSEINSLLGAGTYDVAGLCKATNINPFSRHKPISYPTAFGLTNAQAASVNYGLSLPYETYKTTNYSGMIHAFSQLNWGYNRPSGGSSSPYRLGDFQNYYQNAVPPIQCVYPSNGFFGMAGDKLTVHFDLDPDDGTYNIQSYDLSQSILNLKKKRFMCILCDWNGNVMKANTSDYILDESSGELQDDQVTIRLDGLSAAKYKLYIGLVEEDGSNYKCSSLPRFGEYNPSVYTLTVSRSSADIGGEVVPDVNGDPTVYLSPGYGLAYHTYGECFEEGNASPQYSMGNTTGDLIVRIQLVNNTSSSVTFERSSFAAKVVDGKSKSATRMFTSAPTGTAGSVKSVSIPSKGKQDIWFEFEALFDDYTISASNSSIEVAVYIRGLELFSGSLYYRHSTTAWQRI